MEAPATSSGQCPWAVHRAWSWLDVGLFNANYSKAIHLRPDLLFLAQRLPYPPTKGEKIRAYHELKYLAQWYNIHLGCLIDDPEDLTYIDLIRPMCRGIHVARISRRLNRIACLRGLLTGQALSVAYFHDPGLMAWVRNVTKTINPAVTFVYSSNMAPYVLGMPNKALRVIDLVDVDSEKWRGLAATCNGPMYLIYRREWRKIARLEQRIGHQCDLASFVSDAEANMFASRNPGCPARILGASNGVDHHYFDPRLDHAPVYDRTSPNYVFTGTMDYKPNVDAVRWFACEILPLIRRTLPTARFHIVGSNPSPDVMKLAARDRVLVTGRVPDIRPYIAHATASVAPMRIARGIQNKVLEAMAMARPVVLTSIALQGIAADPVRETIVADTASTFAFGCCRMATTTQGEAIGTAARRRIILDYDWDATLRRFDDVLRPADIAHLAETA